MSASRPLFRAVVRFVSVVGCALAGCGTIVGCGKDVSTPTAPSTVSPTPNSTPTPPVPPPSGSTLADFSIQFIVANPGASLTASDPVSCGSSASSCPDRGTLQNASFTATTTTRSYKMAAGTYRVFGTIRSDGFAGAFLALFFTTPNGGATGGIALEAPRLVSTAGTVTGLTCGANISFGGPSGSMDWHATFRVLTQTTVGQVCP